MDCNLKQLLVVDSVRLQLSDRADLGWLPHRLRSHLPPHGMALWAQAGRTPQEGHQVLHAGIYFVLRFRTESKINGHFVPCSWLITKCIVHHNQWTHVNNLQAPFFDDPQPDELPGICPGVWFYKLLNHESWFHYYKLVTLLIGWLRNTYSS